MYLKRASAYIRVSTDDQTEYSPSAQLSAIKKYCLSNGYVLSKEHIYSDEGKSGRDAEKRPAFMRMIKDAKKMPKQFDVILVHKFDRFARNRADSAVYKSLLFKECGISVISVTESIENNKMSIIMEGMLDAMAEYYSINLGEEVKKGMTEKVIRGEPLTIAPFGYKMINKTLVLDENEAFYVKYIFEEFLKTQNFRRLAEDLNEKGIKTHRGGKFESRTIEYILKNPTYCGFIRWNPKGKTGRNFSCPDLMIVKGTHEPIITEEKFLMVENLIYEIKKRRPKYSKPKHKKSHFLAGLIRCSRCGASMVNSNGYFVCSGYVRGKCEPRNSVRADIIEKLIIDKIAGDFKEEYAVSVLNKNMTNEQCEIENRIKKLTIQLNRAKNAYLSGADTLEEYRENKERICLEIDKEKKRMEGTKNMEYHGALRILSCQELLLDGMGELFIKDVTFSKQNKDLCITYLAF